MVLDIFLVGFLIQLENELLLTYLFHFSDWTINNLNMDRTSHLAKAKFVETYSNFDNCDKNHVYYIANTNSTRVTAEINGIDTFRDVQLSSDGR